MSFEMLKNLFFRSKLPLGLDIGNHALKGILLKRDKQRVLLKQFIYDDSAAFENSTPQELQERLAALIEINQLQKHVTCSAVSDAEVLNYTFMIPKIPAQEIPIVVRNEIEQRLHFPIEEATFDFTTQDVSGDGSSQIQVTAYCARKDFIQTHMALLKQSKLHPLSIEGQLMANVAALEFNGYLQKSDNSYVVIDFGQSHTTMGLVTHGLLGLSNRLDLGSKDLLQRISQTLKVSMEEAEEKNDAHTLILKTFGKNTRAFEKCIDGFYQDLGTQIQSSLSMFSEQAVGTTVEKVFLVGGGSQKKGLLEYLQLLTQLKVEIPNPLRNIDIYNDDKVDGRVGQYGAHFNVAVGLAVRGL